MANVSEYKKKIVKDIIKLAKQYNIIGVVNMQDLPAPQLQLMKSELRGKINLFMTKKRLIKIALEDIKNEKKHIEELEKYLEGMPALLFTNENPFKLSKLLQKSKTSAPARAGQTAPEDIVVAKGPTPFAPGPVISELSSAGLKVGIENGKVAVKEDAVVAKKGDKIKPKVAEILTRLDIKPMQVGLGLIAAYENEVIYQRDVLEVDEKEFNNKINLAATQAFNLAFNITYPTKDNINLLIAKAFNDAKALGISQKILDKGIIEQLLGKAEMDMLGLKDSAGIETKKPESKEEIKPAEEKPKEEVKEEVKKPEQKPEVKEETKAEEKEQSKPEEKKIESPVQEKIEKKEEKVLEEEKKIIEEEQKPKEDDVDKKVKAMVDNTKKFAEGKEETAADIIEEVKKEEQKEEHPKPEMGSKEQVPSIHDLKKQKENKEKTENNEDKNRKEVEDLTKELMKKGTLRKK
jgi:large subunit ribosomal protein L10